MINKILLLTKAIKNGSNNEVIDFVSCNFGQKSYLSFQMELALRSRSIMKQYDFRPNYNPLSSITIIYRCLFARARHSRARGSILDFRPKIEKVQICCKPPPFTVSTGNYTTHTTFIRAIVNSDLSTVLSHSTTSSIFLSSK